MEPTKEQMDDIKGRILNELRVLQETYMNVFHIINENKCNQKIEKKLN